MSDFFIEAEMDLQSHFFWHFIGVTRPLQMIRSPKDRNWILVFEHTRFHHALKSFDVFTCLSCQLPILLLRPLYKAVLIEIENIAKLTICNINIVQIQYILILVDNQCSQGTEVTILEQFCCRPHIST